MNLRSRAWRPVIAVIVAAAVLVVGAGPASAHAALVSVTPSDGSRLDTAPSQVQIVFSEHISAPPNGVRVLDTKGHRVDAGKATIDGATVTVPLESGLGTGGYVVTWNIVSADSHPVSGASVFTVGDAPIPDKGAISAVSTDAGSLPMKTAGAIARFVGYLGILLASGTAIFLALVHDSEPAERRRLFKLVVAGSIVGVLALVLDVPIQAAVLTGEGLRSVTDDGVARSVLGEGVGWTIAAAAFGLAVVVVALAAPVSRFNKILTTAGAVLAACSFATNGHPDTLSSPLVAGIIDSIHLLAAAVWFGGLVSLGVVLAARTEAVSAARVVAKFSLLATVALISVAAAGTYLSWREIGSWHALFSTTYGRLVIAKIVAVAAVAFLGLVNNRRLVPALTKAPERAAALLKRTVRAEAMILVGVIALTSVLVNISPPVSAAATGPISLTMTLTNGAGTAELSIEPGKAGNQLVHVYLADGSGQPLTLQSLQVRASLPSAQLGPISRDGDLTGLAHWTVTDLALTLSGQWQLDLVGQVDQFKAVTGSTEVNIR